MPTPNRPTTRGRSEGYPTARLAETFPTPPSDSISGPSASAVGMPRREFVENRSTRRPDHAAERVRRKIECLEHVERVLAAVRSAQVVVQPDLEDREGGEADERRDVGEHQGGEDERHPTSAHSRNGVQDAHRARAAIGLACAWGSGRPTNENASEDDKSSFGDSRRF